MWTWGSNDSGALGEGTPFQRNTPVAVQGFAQGCSVRRGLTWVKSVSDSCGQTRVTCDDCGSELS